MRGGQLPGTVCEFRGHLSCELFVGVVQVAREMGLARFGKLSVDGTKVRANASKRKAMSYERMGKEAARLQAEIEALLTKAGMVDAEEDERWGEPGRRVARGVATQGEAPGGDPGSQSAFGGGATRRKSPGRAALNLTRAEDRARSEDRGRPPGGRWGAPDHRRDSGGATGQRPGSAGGDARRDQRDVEPAVVLADAGYCNEPDLLELEDRGIDAHVAGAWASPRWRSTRPGSLPRTAWVRNGAPRAKPGTRNASRRRRTGGSRRCSDSDDSACEAWRRCAASGTSCAWR